MSLTERINTYKKEALRRPGVIATTVLLVSLFMLALGLLWTEKYESSATILVEREKLITPLMDGATVTREMPESQADLARQIIFSRGVLEEVRQRGGWGEDEPLTLLEREEIMESIKKRMTIENLGLNMIEVKYRDPDPDRAFRVVTAATSLLISRATELKQAESRGAFKFISAEVDRYKNKLEESESRLNGFLKDNGNIRPGEGEAVGSSVIDLRRDLQDAKLDLEAARITERELTAQLENNDSSVTTITRNDEIYDRIAALENELQDLRLQYHDTYPDIVAIKHKLETLREQLNSDAQTGAGTVNVNPMRQEIRRELLQVRTQIAGLEKRIEENERLLQEEYSRGVDIADVEARAEELSRDYEITREIYQDLLKRRESARLAMDMEEDGEGLNMAIQDPPTVPLSPAGLNFFHFALLGPILGLALALGSLFLRMEFDERIRTPSTISRDLAIPVLGTVPVLADSGVRMAQRRTWIAAVGAIVLLVICYAFVVSLRLHGLL